MCCISVCLSVSVSLFLSYPRLALEVYPLTTHDYGKKSMCTAALQCLKEDHMASG